MVASAAVVPEVPAEFDEALLQLAAAPISTARPIAPKLLAFIGVLWSSDYLAAAKIPRELVNINAQTWSQRPCEPT